jgi:RNA polymerase sigma factor (sigma-70 family)
MEHSRPGVTPSTGPESVPPVGGDSGDVALAARGDAQAFRRLYEAHVGRIHSLARRMVGPDLAAEATQDVFVRAWQKLDSFRGESAFGTWLFRLAINLILSKRGQLAKQRGREVADDELLALQPDRPRSRDLGMDFETAIGRLPDGARQVFVMHDIEGYKHEEIAGLLGVTAGTSKAQLHRARMLMRRVLTKGEGTTR